MIFNLRSLIFLLLFTIQINAQTPTQPYNLSASNLASTTVDLSWDASTGSVAAASYDVYNNGSFVANVLTLSYQVIGLTPNTMYVFTVKAKDAINTESLASAELAVITQSGYCSSNSNVSNEEHISRVQLNTIDNASTAQNYTDFTAISTVLNKGNSYTVTITPIWSPTIWPEAYSVWIDYNQDGDFADSGEQAWTQTSTTDPVVSGMISIPAAALSGETRMRVTMKYNALPLECEVFTYGEVEDYTVHIAGSNDLVYTNGVWSPNAPSNTTVTNDIMVLDGTYTINSDVVVNSIEVDANATMMILKDGSLTASGNFIADNNVVLESDSNEFASLIVSGDVAGIIDYKRHVNSSSNGNDLIAPPVFGQSFTDFQTVNSNIVANGTSTLFLFGPFEKPTNSYITYSNTESAKLSVAKGYRSASLDDDTFTFSGLVTTKDVNTRVYISGSVTPEWNLIGNPYPSYIYLDDFLSLNNSKFNVERSGVYGYDGDASNGWTIWNQAYSDANPNAKIAPGQGFLVGTNTNDIDFNFTSMMRVTGSSDDFIAGRSANTVAISHLQLQLSNASNFYKTDFYITDNATLGQDPNYDSGIFGVTPSLALYSDLVEESIGEPIGIQSIGNTELSEVIIPLGVNASAGEQIVFSISETTLGDDVEVYLEDSENNTFTALNNVDYTFIPEQDLNSTGRFYLRFTASTLSVADTTFKGINIFSENASSTITIKGQLETESNLAIYDIQGRLVKQMVLKTKSTRQKVNVSDLSTGVYIVKLKNNLQEKTQKIIIK